MSLRRRHLAVLPPRPRLHFHEHCRVELLVRGAARGLPPRPLLYCVLALPRRRAAPPRRCWVARPYRGARGSLPPRRELVEYLRLARPPLRLPLQIPVRALPVLLALLAPVLVLRALTVTVTLPLAAPLLIVPVALVREDHLVLRAPVREGPLERAALARLVELVSVGAARLGPAGALLLLRLRDLLEVQAGDTSHGGRCRGGRRLLGILRVLLAVRICLLAVLVLVAELPAKVAHVLLRRLRAQCPEQLNALVLRLRGVLHLRALPRCLRCLSTYSEVPCRRRHVARRVVRKPCLAVVLREQQVLVPLLVLLRHDHAQPFTVQRLHFDELGPPSFLPKVCHADVG
mmetsp:Transcript_14174/g.55773  ORF Transcript_14174/g.55773 Transcript_14174/m.55773 type:complete len:346 (+) Transcript_14174:1240-2277(+)